MEKVKKPTTFSRFVLVSVVQYQLSPTPVEGKCRFLPHSLSRWLVHTGFSSALAQVAALPHSQGLGTALLPSAARIPRPHSAGTGCTATQHSNTPVLNSQQHTKKTPRSLSLTQNLTHNPANCPNVSDAKFRLLVRSLKLCSIKWGVTLLQLTSCVSFSDSQPFSPPEYCVGY